MKAIRTKEVNENVKAANSCLRKAKRQAKELAVFTGEVVRLIDKEGHSLQGFFNRVEFVLVDGTIKFRVVINPILECENCIMASCHEDYLYEVVSVEKFTYKNYRYHCKYSINSLVYWVTYVHNVVYSFYRSMIYCYINSTQRCAGSIVIDIIPTNGADKRKFFPFAPYFPVTNVIKRYFYPYFPAIIGIKGYSFPYFPYLSGIMKIKTALYSLFSRLDWHKTVVFPCLGEIYEGIRSLSWEIPVT